MRGRIIGVFEQEYCNYESKYLILNGLVSISDVFCVKIRPEMP